jgi:hypothetical protein
MAADHLLAVHSNRISERYQRIYFKDVQALIVQEPDYSQRKMIWGGLSALLAIALVTLFFNKQYAFIPLLAIVFAIPFSIFLSIAECRCYAVTALGRYKLGALKNRDSLERALAVLTPLLLEAQKKEEPIASPGPSEVL